MRDACLSGAQRTCHRTPAVQAAPDTHSRCTLSYSTSKGMRGKAHIHGPCRRRPRAADPPPLSPPSPAPRSCKARSARSRPSPQGPHHTRTRGCSHHPSPTTIGRAHPPAAAGQPAVATGQAVRAHAATTCGRVRPHAQHAHPHPTPTHPHPTPPPHLQTPTPTYTPLPPPPTCAVRVPEGPVQLLGRHQLRHDLRVGVAQRCLARRALQGRQRLKARGRAGVHQDGGGSGRSTGPGGAGRRRPNGGLALAAGCRPAGTHTGAVCGGMCGMRVRGGRSAWDMGLECTLATSL